MKHVNIFIMTLCLEVLVLASGTTQASDTRTAKIIFGGINPGKKFAPADTTVMVGDTILWMGFFGPKDPFHALQSVSVPAGAAPFGPDTTGTSFRYVVTIPGTYQYQCNNHCCGTKGNMQGRFTVIAAGVSSQTSNSFATLEKNFPNPSKGSTTIRYTLIQPSEVSLKVFDLSGKEVKELVHGFQNPGSHETLFDGSALPSGTYTYQLKTGDAILSQQMILVKQ